jgi:CheY-like chemotaxis protein
MPAFWNAALSRNGAFHVWRVDQIRLDLLRNELAPRLRRLPATEKSALIAVTGYGQEDDRRTTWAAGFDHHFVKPVNTKELASVLANIRPH